MSPIVCLRTAVLSLGTTTFVSCGGPNVPGKPIIDADAAAARAMELFDSNSDGTLDDGELKQCPGVAEGKARVDSNGDGRISADELTARIADWNESPNRIVCPELLVTLNGRAVANAKVTFEPEPFLTEWREADKASTDEMGRVSPQISRQLPGMDMGYYRVKVSKVIGGKERIPANYNEQTEVGIEFCEDRPAEEDLLIEIQLGTRKRR